MPPRRKKGAGAFVAGSGTQRDATSWQLRQVSIPFCRGNSEDTACWMAAVGFISDGCPSPTVMCPSWQDRHSFERFPSNRRSLLPGPEERWHELHRVRSPWGFRGGSAFCGSANAGDSGKRPHTTISTDTCRKPNDRRRFAFTGLFTICDN